MTTILSRRSFLCAALASTSAGPSALAATSPKPSQTGPVMDWSQRPKGPVMLAVSIAEQKLTILDDGQPVGRFSVSTGVDAHPTPQGLFTILIKKRFHRSNIYDSAPMPYMQRLTWSGVALHQGHVTGRTASHGCIRLPAAVAEKLFAYTPVGTRVIITDKAAAPSEITHPKLFSALPNELKLASNTQTPELPAAQPAPAYGHVAMMISAKERKLFMRQNFMPIFESPVSIEGDAPLGTHLFTAMSVTKDDGAVRWSHLAMPDASGMAADARAALERVQLSDEAKREIAARLAKGTSLIISDLGLGRETGRHGASDFIVVTG